MMSAESSTAYLLQVLRIDPVHHPREVIERRAQFLGHLGDESGASPSTSHDRELIRKALTAFSENLFSVEHGDSRKLDELNTDAFPDLDRWKQRLSVARTLREDFARATADPRIGNNILSLWKMLVVAPEDEEAMLRESAIDALLNRRSLRSISRLRRRHRRIYETRRALFEEVRRTHAQRRRNRRDEGCRKALRMILVAALCLWIWSLVVKFQST